MSRSFTVDFKAYTLYQSIGNEKNRLERKIGLHDVICSLMEEGFNNFESRYGFVKSYGIDANGFRDQIAAGVLGIPRDALVRIEYLGARGLINVHFDY